MNGAAAAMLVVLGLSTPVRTPELQVEASTAAGAELPELAEAVARALVAGGARVVMRGPTSGTCDSCGKVKVIETQAGLCQVEVRHAQHTASTTLRLPTTSSLFDQARAIAIQARLLMPWQTAVEGRSKDLASRSSRKPEARGAGGGARASAPPRGATRGEPFLASTPADSSSPALAPAPVRLWPTEPAAAERAAPAPLAVPPVVYTSRSDSRPVSRPGDGKPLARVETAPASRATVSEPSPSETESVRRTEAAVDRPRGDAARLPSAELVAGHEAAPRSHWPWIPTTIGAGAAVAAGLCAVVARGHYDALSDQQQSYGSARAHKSAGEHWQTASLVLSGVAVVGVGAGLLGFATRSSGGSAVTVLASPVPGGGMLAIAGELP